MKHGLWKIVRFIFVAILAIPTLYSFARWGTLLPIPLLTLCLITIITGILVSLKSALAVAIFFGCYLGLVMHLHKLNILVPDLQWLNTTLYPNYTIEITTVLIVIVGIMWLNFNEMEQSLRRARRIEAQLKKEKDTLETRVLERTQELEKIQMQRMLATARMAEIGKISTGLFHDLINPLMAISLFTNHLKNISHNESSELQKYINETVKVSDRLNKFAKQIKQELSRKAQTQRINVAKALAQVLKIVTYQCNQYQIELKLECPHSQYIICDPFRFQRSILNIVINAIEALVEAHSANPKIVITYEKMETKHQIYIKDNGPGIPPETISHLFDSFFSTKTKNHGLGLRIARDLLSEELTAQIEVKSQINVGSTFIISWNT